jgi:hypothetical protein
MPSVATTFQPCCIQLLKDGFGRANVVSSNALLIYQVIYFIHRELL